VLDNRRMTLVNLNLPTSSNISAARYDPDSQSLYITFRYQSATYKYEGIDEDSARGFERALSATDYLKQAILSISSGERVS